jgi:3',5'-cyclic-AMP phosphodiesterase
MTAAQVIVAQLTDTHIRPPGRLAYRQVDTAQHLAAAVALLASPPVPIDAVIVTGDLVDFGTDEEYANFRRLVAPLSLPLYPIPGNHDERGALRRAFADRLDLPAAGPLSYVAEAGALRLILLDSTVPGRPHGEMTAESLALLDRALAQDPSRPALVGLHHPPFATGIRHMDAQNCFGAEGLEEVLRRHPQVLATVCGHVHRTVLTTFAGRAAAIGPSPAHAVSLDLSPNGPPTFTMEPPALLLHVWDPGTPNRLATHWLPVGRFDGPYPFFDGTGRLIE